MHGLSKQSNERLALLGGSPVRSDDLPHWPPPASPRLLDELNTLLQLDASPMNAAGSRHGVEKLMFEDSFARYCGTSFAIAVNSGTTALDLAIDTLNLRPDGVVVAANYGHPATIRRAAAHHRLRLIDVRADTLCLSPEGLRDALGWGNVACVITTHFAGQPGGVEEIASLCRGAEIPLIEDSSHAHGAVVSGRRAGSFGNAGCFSLHATKPLSAGEGGVITCSDRELFGRIYKEHDIGRVPGAKPYNFASLGGNYRLSEMASLMARHRLAEIDRQNVFRMSAMQALREQLGSDGPLELPAIERGVEVHSFHLIATRYRSQNCCYLTRGRFILALSAEGIPCSAGWPSTLSAIPAVLPHCEEVSTPVASQAVLETVWLDPRLLFADNGVVQIAEAVHKIQRLACTLRRQT
jgi:dTDP-4-amino-4,6-dideoxygalactose transaminase